MTDVARRQILFSLLKFRTTDGRRPSFTVAIDFRCCNRSRDVSRTSLASGDLKNICLVCEIFQFLFAVLELVLLPVYGGCYRFPVYQYVARSRSYFLCVGRPRKCTLKFWNVSPITCRSTLVTTSRRRRLYFISVNHLGLLTFSILRGNNVHKTQYQLLESVTHSELDEKTMHSSVTPRKLNFRT
jgi:hypothetical protein